jgi:8-oxo-dGTP pyrophosphatase MutT (NUDIX family)
VNDRVSETSNTPPLALSADDFFARARARLSLAVPAALTDFAAPATRGDLDLDPAVWQRAGVAATRPAAVLVPIVARAEPTVLLTERTADLSSHAGQIAFPGGKLDNNEGPLAGALREAEEEIGLAAAQVEPIGFLDLYFTFSGFRILPVVARVPEGFTLTLNQGEVADAFEVPLAFLMAVENHQRKTRDWKGILRHYYEMPFGERHIWGVTAGIVRNLYERLYGA